MQVSREVTVVSRTSWKKRDVHVLEEQDIHFCLSGSLLYLFFSRSFYSLSIQCTVFITIDRGLNIKKLF